MTHRRSVRPVTTSLVGALALALVVAFAFAGDARAFRMIQNSTVGRVSAGAAVPCNAAGGFAHWNARAIPWRLNASGQGAGKDAALASALDAWTQVPSADHVLTLAGTTTAGFSTDGVNTLLWARGNGCNGNCLAITALVLQAGQVIVETDVSFNSRYAWRTDGGTYDTQSVATHEVGHALGIHHTEITGTPRPTMYASYFGTDGRTLEGDDSGALQCSESRY
jgi:hypothetical protein